MKRVLLGLAAFLTSTSSVFAEVTVCDGGDVPVSVNSKDSNITMLICEAVTEAQRVFEQCNVPALADPLRIDLVEDIPKQCVALYHCGEDYIKVLSPALMQSKRLAEGAFTFLPIEQYFQSVIVHEITHAAFDAVPCPISSCVVGAEYVAYAMQVKFLSPEDRQRFVDLAGLDRKISRDELSALILYMAPHLFAQKAWTHLSQRENPCGYIGQITDGTVLLDFEVFE